MTSSAPPTAEARAREAHPELVISDVLMPVMDGYELAGNLRADPHRQGGGDVLYRLLRRPGRASLAQAHGVSRVLVKPSDNDEILREVKAALASRHEVPAQASADLDQEHLRVMVDQLLEKTGALELQQRRIERLNRTLEMLSAINALIVRAGDRQALLDEACHRGRERRLPAGGHRPRRPGQGDARWRRRAKAAPNATWSASSSARDR